MSCNWRHYTKPNKDLCGLPRARGTRYCEAHSRLTINAPNNLGCNPVDRPAYIIMNRCYTMDTPNGKKNVFEEVYAHSEEKTILTGLDHAGVAFASVIWLGDGSTHSTQQYVRHLGIHPGDMYQPTDPTS